ncbi:MAG: hypothetical protein EU547_03140 [Promethearchaeota archaeon]|nr:MAG: hypothetical protein EU547_03140 [Candidatus Lokiarchaeota archaeon]
MSYTPIHPGIVPLLIIYFILIASGLYIIKKMYDKWKERNSKLPLYLGLVFLALIIALVFLAVGLMETIITGYFKEIYRITFPLSYVCVVIADIILFKFTNEITESSGRLLYVILIIGIVIIVMLLLPWNWWGVPQEDYEGKLSIRIYSTLIFTLYSIIIYLIIAIISLKARNKATEKKTRFGFLLYALSVLCLVLFFLMNVMENILIVFFNHIGYSIFIYIGWVFAFLFIILSYFSLVMPKWLTERLKL